MYTVPKEGNEDEGYEVKAPFPFKGDRSKMT